MHGYVRTRPVSTRCTGKSCRRPTPGPGEVLVEIKAASLNFPDLLIVQNKYQMKPELPFVPGSEYAGVVQAVGEGVHASEGRASPSPVCRAPAASAPTPSPRPRCACRCPTASPFVDAAAFIMIYATSYHALIDRARARRPAKPCWCWARPVASAPRPSRSPRRPAPRVIAAASTDEKCALCTQLGADATINYQRDNLREAIKTLTDGKGPDVIYDPVGGDFTEPAFRSIAWRGRYLVVGFAAGPIPSLPLNLALLKGASIVGVFWGDFARREAKANAAMMEKLLGWYAAGKIKPAIDRTMPMAELKAAYAHMGSRGVMGKLVMVN